MSNASIRGASFPQVHEPPREVKLEIQNIYPPEPRKPVTRAMAFAKRLDEMTALVRAEANRFLSEHGDDPRAWPLDKVGRLAELESQRLALDALGRHAKERDTMTWNESDLGPRKDK